MAKVGIRKLKSNLKYYLSLVKKGEQVTITNRGNEVALIVLPEDMEIYTRLTRMVKGGMASWEGVKPRPRQAIKVAGKPASTIIIEDRR